MKSEPQTRESQRTGIRRMPRLAFLAAAEHGRERGRRGRGHPLDWRRHANLEIVLRVGRFGKTQRNVKNIIMREISGELARPAIEKRRRHARNSSLTKINRADISTSGERYQHQTLAGARRQSRRAVSFVNSKVASANFIAWAVWWRSIKIDS